MTPEQTRSLLKNHDDLRTRRSYWEGHWQDIRELVRPSAEEMRKITTPGRVKTQYMYDTTAPEACKEFASGLQSYTMSPGDRWFDIKVVDDPEGELNRDHDVMVWLEYVADLIYSQFQSAKTRFNSAIAEAFMDLGSYGTFANLIEWNDDEQRPLYRTYPLRDCWFAENSKGLVDTVHHAYKMDRRQLEMEFTNLPEKLQIGFNQKQNADRQWEIIHVVRPRKDRDIKSFTKTNMPYASFWLCRDTSELIEESGYQDFPWVVARWMKLSDETYGRSPAMEGLPDIKMLNAMAKTFIKVSQKVSDPPLVVPDDGFLLPLRTHPGSLIYKAPGTEPIESLPVGERNLPITWEVLQGQQAKVKIIFHADWLRMGKEDKEMTAFEAQDRRDEKLRFLAPNLGRLETEASSPIIVRTFNLLMQHGQIPEPPALLAGRKIHPEYVSPAAKAQSGIKAANMTRFVADTIPLSEVSPGVLDIIDFDKFTAEMARYRHVSRQIIRSPKDIARVRAERAQQEQAQQLAGAAEPMSKAVKNLADAGQSMGGGL